MDPSSREETFLSSSHILTTPSKSSISTQAASFGILTLLTFFKKIKKEKKRESPEERETGGGEKDETT